MLKQSLICLVAYVLFDWAVPSYVRQIAIPALWPTTSDARIKAEFRRSRLARFGFALCAFIIVGIELHAEDSIEVQLIVLVGVFMIASLATLALLIRAIFVVRSEVIEAARASSLHDAGSNEA